MRSLLLLGLIVHCLACRAPEGSRNKEQNSSLKNEAEALRKQNNDLVNQLASTRTLLEKQEVDFKLKEQSYTNQLSSFLQFFNLQSAIIEKRQIFIAHFTKEWTPVRETLYKAAGGFGKLTEFEIEDVYCYRGYVVVNTLNAWQNDDGSGGIARGAIALDPDKDFEISSCEIVDKMLISREQLAAMSNGQQMEAQAAASLPHRPEAATFTMSEDTKNKLWQVGATVASALFLRLLQD